MTKSLIAAALAAAVAMPALAQTQQQEPERKGSLGDAIRRGTGRTDAQRAPQPAAQQAQTAPAQGQAQGATLTPEQSAALGTMWSRHQLAIQAGDMAVARGTSPEVKKLAREMTEEHRRAQADLQTYVARRGGDVNAFPPSPEQQRIQGEIAQLNAKTGEEFDRAYVSFLTRNHATFVEDLKRARDTTAGKDAEFKRWLDAVENVEEKHLASARQLKVERDQQRQGRTPPRR